MEHGSPQDVAGVVGLDLDLVVHAHDLVQADWHDLLHAVLDHLRGEEVRLALPVHGHLPHVLQQDRRDRLRRLSHVDRTVVADHFCHEGEGATVIEVKVRDDDAVDVAGEGVAPYSGAVLLLSDVAEVGEPALVLGGGMVH